MWLAIRTELAYFRPWLLGAFGITAVVTLLITIVFLAVDDGPNRAVAAGMRGFFPLIAGLVVGYIAQSYFSEERRVRLLLSGPLTPPQVAGVVVFVPAIMFGIGARVAATVIAIEWMITGRLEPETWRMISGVGGMLFAAGQVGPLAQESTAARRQERPRASLVGWSSFVILILLLQASQFVLGTLWANLGQFAIGLAAMAMSFRLYTSRNDFTR